MQDSNKPQEGSPRKNPDPMATFTGKEGIRLSLDEASRRTAAFRERYPGKVKGNFYGAQIIKEILSQPGCVGVRVYNAINPATGELDILLVGADADQNDILTITSKGGGSGKGCNPISAIIALPASAASTQGAIGGDPMPCPTCCGVTNPLNGGGK